MSRFLIIIRDNIQIPNYANISLQDWIFSSGSRVDFIPHVFRFMDFVDTPHNYLNGSLVECVWVSIWYRVKKLNLSSQITCT